MADSTSEMVPSSSNANTAPDAKQQALSEELELKDIQVRFVSKNASVDIPDDPFSVPLRLGPSGLSEIVNALAQVKLVLKLSTLSIPVEIGKFLFV